MFSRRAFCAAIALACDRLRSGIALARQRRSTGLAQDKLGAVDAGPPKASHPRSPRTRTRLRPSLRSRRRRLARAVRQRLAFRRPNCLRDTICRSACCGTGAASRRGGPGGSTRDRTGAGWSRGCCGATPDGPGIATVCRRPRPPPDRPFWAQAVRFALPVTERSVSADRRELPPAIHDVPIWRRILL